jgi:hypothetical protein
MDQLLAYVTDTSPTKCQPSLPQRRQTRAAFAPQARRTSFVNVDLLPLWANHCAAQQGSTRLRALQRQLARRTSRMQQVQRSMHIILAVC